MLPTVGTSLKSVGVARATSSRSRVERLASRLEGFVTEGIVPWKSMSPATRSTRRRRVPAEEGEQVLVSSEESQRAA